MGMSLKHLTFVMLVLQNTALGIVSKYSRLVDGPKYKPGTVIFLVELVKFLICFFVLCKVRMRNATLKGRGGTMLIVLVCCCCCCCTAQEGRYAGFCAVAAI